MKLVQVVKQKTTDGKVLGHSYLVYLSGEEMEALERIAQERFTAPTPMKMQSFLRHIVRQFIAERTPHAAE